MLNYLRVDVSNTLAFLTKQNTQLRSHVETGPTYHAVPANGAIIAYVIYDVL